MGSSVRVGGRGLEKNGIGIMGRGSMRSYDIRKTEL